VENALIYQIQQLLAHTKISFDKEELAFQIQSHPSYPSLHAITGVLDHFNIDNLALDIPKTESVLEQLPKAFLGQITTDEGNDFALILRKGDKIIAVRSAKEKNTYTISAFLELFTGIIVAIEKDPQQAEKPVKSNRYKNGLWALLGLILVALLVLVQPGIVPTAYFLLSIAGLITSVAIVKQHFGLHSSIGNAFCSDTDTTKNCNAVLSSTGAKLFGTFKLSDASLIYFTSITLGLIASLFETSGLHYLYGISLLAIPVIFYSIYYQYAFAKAWCPLCLIIAAVLASQSILAAIYLPDLITTVPSWTSGLLIVGIFAATMLFWNPIAATVAELKSLKQSKIDYFKFKRQFEIFKTQLNLSPIQDIAIPNTGEIVFGNKEADVSIVVITSPFCGHCKPVHSTIEGILKKFNHDIAVTVRFSANPEQSDGNLFKIVSRLTELYHTEGHEACLSAMHEIYESGDTEAWLAQWGTCKKVVLYREVLEKQYQWCFNNNINFTPEILINGRSFPKTYDRADLSFFIEDLIEDASSMQEVEIPHHI
jgi:uncharacterized membrane protein